MDSDWALVRDRKEAVPACSVEAEIKKAGLLATNAPAASRAKLLAAGQRFHQAQAHRPPLILTIG